MNDNRYWLLLPVAYSAVLLHWRSYTLTGAVRVARCSALRSNQSVARAGFISRRSRCARFAGTGAVRFARDWALRSKSKSIFFISVSGV